MGKKDLSYDEVKNMSLIRLAKFVLSTEKRSMKFTDIFEKVSELKGLSEELKQDKLSQFYTDLNVDGNFIKDHTKAWGLKRWYGGQKEVTATTVPLNRKSSRKNELDGDLDEVDLDEFELLDENIDDIDEDELVEGFEDEEMDYNEDFDKVEADQ